MPLPLSDYQEVSRDFLLEADGVAGLFDEPADSSSSATGGGCCGTSEPELITLGSPVTT